MIKRTDVRDFEKIPDELKVIPRWECWKVGGGQTVLIDTRTGRFVYGQGMGAKFAEAMAYFIAHEDLIGIFFRFKESDDWSRMLRTAEAAGGDVTHEYVGLMQAVPR